MSLRRSSRPTGRQVWVLAAVAVVLAGVVAVWVWPDDRAPEESMAWDRVEVAPDGRSAVVFEYAPGGYGGAEITVTPRDEAVEVGVWRRARDSFAEGGCPLTLVSHLIEWDPGWTASGVVEPEGTAEHCSEDLGSGAGVNRLIDPSPDPVAPGDLVAVGPGLPTDVYLLRGRGPDGWGVPIATLAVVERERQQILLPGNDETPQSAPLLYQSVEIRLPEDLPDGPVQLCDEAVTECAVFTVEGR